MTPPLRLLFITSTRIGDAVLSSGVLDHFLRSFPGARVTIAAGPLAAPLFEAVPGRERTLVMTKQKGGMHWLRLWGALALEEFDITVDLRGSLTTLFVHARHRHIAQRTKEGGHKVEEAARMVGLAAPVHPVLWISDEARAKASARLGIQPPFIAISPAASAPFKEWATDRFGALCTRLVESHPNLAGAHVVGLGGPGDKSVVTSALAGVRGAEGHNLAGALSIPETAAVIQRSAFFVGNDSGLMHIAAAAGVPTLGLFGPTDERVYGPWGHNARAVRAGAQVDASLRAQARHGSESMMGELSVDQVYDAARALLSSARDPATPAQTQATTTPKGERDAV